uniref:MAT111 n=1 Tax=Huntiella omanensis TaxID=1580864 RepID=A0A1D9CT44_9PEZI|nr:MAT111 [Huntiella omanensis]
MAPTRPIHSPQRSFDHGISKHTNDVNLRELLRNLSNEQILRLIPKSAVENLHQISTLIRAGDFNADEVFNNTEPCTPPSQSPPGLTPSPSPTSPKLQRQDSSHSSRSSTTSDDKVKRPLNGFIAFRAYYQRIFTQVPQKSISALITRLWKSDPFQSRWMLMGRVYSFIRDTVGKNTAKLSDFLEVAVPIMGVPVPEAYLAKLCWIYTGNEVGELAFFQDPTGLQRYLDTINSTSVPSTEQDLLNYCLVHDYLPDHGDALLTKLAQNNTSLITVQGRPPRRNRNKAAYGQVLKMEAVVPEPNLVSSSFTISPTEIPPPSIVMPRMASQGADVWLTGPASPLPAAYLPTQVTDPLDIFNMPMHEIYDVMEGFNAHGSAF